MNTQRMRLLVFGTLLLSPLVAGFSSGPLFDLPADEGGGGGYTYTGSPPNRGMGCAQCHQGHEGSFSVEMYSTPGGLVANGYEPGQTYQLRIRLLNERAGLDRQGACLPLMGGCNRNAFVAQITDAAGAPSGVFCPLGIAYNADGSCADESGSGTTLIADGSAIGGQSLTPPLDCAASGAVPGQCIDIAALQAAGKSQSEIYAAISAGVRGSTEWSLQWRAPNVAPATNAALHLWLGAVDGDGGTTVDPSYNDYAGDGVVMTDAVIRLATGDAPAAPGCAGGGAAAWWLVWMGVLAITWRWRARA